VVEMMRFCLLDVISVGAVDTPRFSRTSYLARARTPEAAGYATDLMRRARERAARDPEDRILDEFSFARLEGYGESAIDVRGLKPRFSVDRARFTCRFRLQPGGTGPSGGVV
jgi:hypothetical protein